MTQNWRPLRSYARVDLHKCIMCAPGIVNTNKRRTYVNKTRDFHQLFSISVGKKYSDGSIAHYPTPYRREIMPDCSAASTNTVNPVQHWLASPASSEIALRKTLKTLHSFHVEAHEAPGMGTFVFGWVYERASCRYFKHLIFAEKYPN